MSEDRAPSPTLTIAGTQSTAVASGPAGAPSPDDPRLRAWVAFLQAYAVVTRRLEAELQAERGLSLADYDALVQLAVADDRRPPPLAHRHRGP